MALFLSEADVGKIVTIELALEAVESAHRAHAENLAIDICRERTRLPKTALHILQGALPAEDAIGFKAYTSNKSGVRFMVYLYSASGGHLRAAMEGNLLGMMRTGAASGLATQLLAREDAKVLGMFGSGWQAEGHLAAILAVRKISQVKVFGRNSDKLNAFCQKMGARFGVEIIAAKSAEETVRDSDIVSTITTANTPLFEASWLKEGAHVNGAGSNSLIRREIGEDTIKRASIIVVDSRESALKEAGDLLPSLEKGQLTARKLVELGEILIGTEVGKSAGRTSAEEITLFESQGMAIQDLALAVRLEKLAHEQGLGVELPFGM